ncbi:MAG: hypothetical protein CME59_00605 [Halioglobus sp.]|nr:hypothetical protein [Halioglobus sp.]|tara:strand:+ start:395 stop:988 length:594 start_codon:yes stop_codon:yes gene_type:complete
MKDRLSTLLKSALFSLLALAAAGATAEDADDATSGGRAMAMQMEAVVTAVDLETRQVSLQGPGGEIVTVNAREQVVKLEDVHVGDVLVATYMAALEGELREPTAEELAEPWVVLEDGVVSGEGEDPGIGAARMIRAVCTIEGMNRVLGTVTVEDTRGNLHLITDVEPEKMEGVTLGQTLVIVYAEAVALSLEQKHAE